MFSRSSIACERSLLFMRRALATVPMSVALRLGLSKSSCLWPGLPALSLMLPDWVSKSDTWVLLSGECEHRRLTGLGDLDRAPEWEQGVKHMLERAAEAVGRAGS